MVEDKKEASNEDKKVDDSYNILEIERKINKAQTRHVYVKVIAYSLVAALELSNKNFIYSILFPLQVRKKLMIRSPK